MELAYHAMLFFAMSLAAIFLVLMMNFGGKLLVEKMRKKNKYHPIGGTLIHQKINFSRLHDYMTDFAKKYKTYRLLGLFRSEVFTADPAIVEHILKTNFPNYVKGWHHYNILTDLLGDGIFTVDGDKWRHQRKVSSYEFSTRNLKDFSSAVFRSKAVKLAQIVSNAASSNQVIEVQDLFMKSALDSVFKVVLGVELDTMCGTFEAGKRFSDAFDEASELTLYRYVDLFWKIKRFLNIGSEAVLKRNIKVINDFVYQLIRNKTEQVNKSRDDPQEKKHDVISRFLESEATDPKYLKDIVLSFIIAGKDTTATTLSWFLYMLCKHPHMQEKIAQEVKEATKMKGDPKIEDIASRLTEESLDKMQYLQAALFETLRLYPAVPTDGKLCLSDDTLPDGFTIKRGDSISFNPYAMGRMKFIWGEDADEFKPERWLDKDGICRQESPFKLTAFQAGPRICLGKEFASRQMKIFSAVLLGIFKFELNDEKKPVNYRVMLTLHINEGLYLRAYKRLPDQKLSISESKNIHTRKDQ